MVVRIAFTGALRAYTSALHKNPIATQVVSSGCLWAIGDLAAQRAIEDRSFDGKRFVLTSVYGGLFNGIVGHIWYLKLDSVARRLVGRPGTPRFIAAKVFADSVIFGPVHVGAFFTFLTAAEGGNLRDVQRKLQQDLLPSLAAEVTVWPAVQAVNFSLVPLQYQLLVVNAFTILDATFMSWVQHNNGWIYKLFPQWQPGDSHEPSRQSHVQPAAQLRLEDAQAAQNHSLAKPPPA